MGTTEFRLRFGMLSLVKDLVSALVGEAPYYMLLLAASLYWHVTEFMGHLIHIPLN